MLDLLVFAPCQRVVVDEDEKLTSMLILLEAIDITKDSDFPVDAVVPMSWNLLCLWHRSAPVEKDIIFEQRVDVIRPDGERVGGSEVKFTVTNEFRNFRNRIRMDGFPVGIVGEHILRLSIREAGEENEWRQVATYPVLVRHKEVAVTEEKGADGEKSGTEATEVH
jgi:hypothetical protein